MTGTACRTRRRTSVLRRLLISHLVVIGVVLLLIAVGALLPAARGVPRTTVGVVFASVGAMLLALCLSGWVLRPIRRLNDAARRWHGEAGTACHRGAPLVDSPAETTELSGALEALASRLEATCRAQRTLVADLSHQLRNPLTALRVRVECLEPVVAEPELPRLQAAVSEAERLGQVLDQMLSLSLAAERQVPNSAVSTRQVVQARTRAWSAVAASRAVSLEVRGDDVPAAAVTGVLDQVLDVLLDNALRLSPPGGTVRVTVARDGDTVLVDVADEGPGLSDADKQRACDRHWHRDAPGYSGTGLGLAIASSLLAAADGGLTLHDAMPRGLRVRVRLPAWRGDGVPAGSPPWPVTGHRG